MKIKPLIKFSFFLLSALVYFNLFSHVLAASFSFSPAAVSTGTNQQFTLNILLDTDSADTDGADAIVSYDNSFLTPVSAGLGNLYDTKVTANTSVSGKITLSAVASADSSFSGSGTFATLVFRALKAGSTTVNFSYTSGSTTDSNVTSSQQDVLSSVSSTSVSIAASDSTDESYTPPVTGTAEWTTLLTLGGITLILLSFYARKRFS